MTQPPQYPGSPDPDPSEQPPAPGGQTPPPLPPQAPYGAPQQENPYAQPAPPQSPYGAPQQPYGAPQQPYAYGQQFPSGPGNDQPSKGMAIAALVLSFLACTVIAGIVSIVLAIVVLVRGKDGRNHGKGLAISAIIVSVLVMIVTAVVVAAGVVFVEEQSIDNLKVGECFNADDLDDESVDYVGLIDKVSCNDAHDAEVVSTGELTATEAADFVNAYDCSPYVDPELLTDHFVFGITQDAEPDAGDTVACIAIRADGGKLQAPIG